jgi:chemotaxis regulatin CheY-phosphate phosphatase CheZ
MQVHNEFKELVDRLLTEFLEELGTRPEAFFATITEQLHKDKFTEFVVNTILTVDDFLMFKAMMVKRNVDLTNQVERILL